jgi:GNAT superfamily N-acetyltransferase
MGPPSIPALRGHGKRWSTTRLKPTLSWTGRNELGARSDNGCTTWGRSSCSLSREYISPLQMDIEIVQAELDDHTELTEIALASKGYWGYPDAWMASWKDELQITPDKIESSLVYKAVEQGQVAGFYVLAGAGDIKMIDHLWVKPDYIGHGIGRELWMHALAQAAAQAARQVEVVSDPNALGFYLKMGAYQVGTIPSSILGRELPILRIDLHAVL